MAKIPHVIQGAGHYGEYLTEYALNEKSIPGRHVTYSNVLVPRVGATSTAELDVVMLHEQGIFVVESKNYSGWIFGSADQRQWTVSYKGGRKERFYNPVLQNRGHVKALAAYLGLPENAFKSYIVFSERCELKKVPLDTGEYAICRRHHLARDMRRELASGTPLFDNETFDMLKTRLDELAAASTGDAKAEHVQQAQAVAAGAVCPRCGKSLVERRRKSDGGTFVGCSGFPTCRYTRSEW